MLGYRDVLATDGYRMRRAAIDRFSSWGGSDESYSQLDEELSTAFNTTNIQRHLVKLRRMEADERHLFLILGVYDLPFTLFGSLASGEGLPTGAPALPEGLTHLWLAPEYCWRVLIGAAAVSTSTVLCALRRRGLLLPSAFHTDRRSWSRLRKRGTYPSVSGRVFGSLS